MVFDSLPIIYGPLDPTGFVGTSGDAARDEACKIATAPHAASGTVQLGVAGSGMLGPLGYTGGAGVAADAHGNVGLYAFGGFGSGIGIEGDFGPAVAVSNRRWIRDLLGPFNNLSVSGGDVLAGTADVFLGRGTAGNPVREEA